MPADNGLHNFIVASSAISPRYFRKLFASKNRPREDERNKNRPENPGRSINLSESMGGNKNRPGSMEKTEGRPESMGGNKNRPESLEGSESQPGKSGAVREDMPGQAVQKYVRLLMEGLALQDGTRVTAISGTPVNEKNHKGSFIPRKREYKRGVSYVYLPVVNRHGIRDIIYVITSFLECLRYIKRDRSEGRDSIVVADVLSAPVAMGAYLAARLTGRPYTALVTDLPEYVYAENDKAYRTVSDMLIKSAVFYVFLTEQMNEKINEHKRPYTVIEGIVDITQKGSGDTLPTGRKDSKIGHLNEKDPKICLYTGNLNRKYGVMTMAKGFLRAKVPNSVLYICGKGDTREALEELAKDHDNIVFCGEVLSEEAVRMQKEADLLINPRPSSPEYTKYSFPSKIMEYMASGTCVLMTDLPGVGGEYKEKAFIIKDESEEGMAESISEVLCKSDSELEVMGRKAREFVAEHKNKRIQAAKLWEMFE